MKTIFTGFIYGLILNVITMNECLRMKWIFTDGILCMGLSGYLWLKFNILFVCMSLMKIRRGLRCEFCNAGMGKQWVRNDMWGNGFLNLKDMGYKIYKF